MLIRRPSSAHSTTLPRGPYQRKTNIDPAGTKPGTKPFEPLAKNGGIPG
jgi:hypothetical protein